MKRITLISLLLLCARRYFRQDWGQSTLEKSPRHASGSREHDNRSVETFVVYPEAKGKTPVVLIITKSLE